MARGGQLGLGAFRQTDEPTRLPVDLKAVAQEVREIANDVEAMAGPEEDEAPRPAFMRGDFDANLAEELSESDRSRIAMDLLRGIEADLTTRKDWEQMVERAIRYCGIIYEEPSGEASGEGSISKAWHTLLMESSVGFWANAHAEFLPADGPVKVRDDAPPLPMNPPSPLAGGAGAAMGASPSGPSNLTQTQLAEAFEADFNHYLTTGDKQYYRDFSRMLFSLGPKGTEFRKVYYHPLRRMPVSEWVKSENLIVSNDAADLSTAGRITERIMTRQADVKRMQWKGLWLDVHLTQPVDQPTQIEETIGRSEGIQQRRDLPADHLHTIYECCCELDLPGFEHQDERGGFTGLPLPYRVTLDKDSRQVLEIRRHWREEDQDFQPRQRYVMFGLLPGFGFYYLGYVHILGNTERALTALEREVIDNQMMAIFPGWFAAKGAFERGETQVRVGIGGVKEVNLGMAKSINEVIQPVQVAPLSPQALALFEKLEANGRALSGKFDVPVGEGTANIPVGTMIAMIEQGTKVMAAVHKGLHASRAEELELLRELMAEEPEALSRFSQSGTEWEEFVEALSDMDFVPSSDPNTPSHIHRVMTAVALAQVVQMFPDLANRKEAFNELLSVIRISDPERFINQMPQQAQPDPKMMDAQMRMGIAQLNAKTKLQDTATRAQQSGLDRKSKEQIALIDAHSEQVKTQAQLAGDQAKQHDSAAEQAIDAERERTHDIAMQGRDQAHEAREAHLDRVWPQVNPTRSF